MQEEVSIEFGTKGEGEYGSCENIYSSELNSNGTIKMGKDGLNKTVRYEGSKIKINKEKLILDNASIIKTLTEELIHSSQAKLNPRKIKTWEDEDKNKEYLNKRNEIDAKSKTNIIIEQISNDKK